MLAEKARVENFDGVKLGVRGLFANCACHRRAMPDAIDKVAAADTYSAGDAAPRADDRDAHRYR